MVLKIQNSSTILKILLLTLLTTGVFAKEISEEYYRSNNNFTIDVLAHLGHTKNVIFSPFSLETILTLTSLGAKGDTASEIKKVLHLEHKDEKIKSEFNFAHTEMEQVKHLKISSANRIYLKEGFEIEHEFLKTASETFRAGVKNMDFSASKKACQEINSWVENKTDDKIKDLMKEDQLNELTSMVLVNALFVKGKWQVPFDPADTIKRDFHLSKTEKIQVDTMKVTGDLYRCRSDKYRSTLLRFPYAGTGNRGFLAILISDDLDDLNQLQTNLESIIKDQKFTKEYMTAYLPKLKVESALEFKPILKKMGITKLFDNPDLSGITKEKVVIDAINQKTFMEVNEFGTVAASATAAIGTTYSAVTDIPTEYHIDRPFIFAILYDQVALISGTIINPLEG